MRYLCALCLSLMFVISGCAETSLNKQQKAHADLAQAEDRAAADAIAAGNVDAASAHTLAAAEARARVADLEAKRQAARDSDTNAWSVGTANIGALSDLIFPGLSAVVAVVGTLFTQKLRGKTFTDGQTQGAITATTAITNADTSDTLQTPMAKTAVANNLVGASPNVIAAVNAAI